MFTILFCLGKKLQSNTHSVTILCETDRVFVLAERQTEGRSPQCLLSTPVSDGGISSYLVLFCFTSVDFNNEHILFLEPKKPIFI